MATFGSEWIPLSGARERLGWLGARGEATAPGKGKNRQRGWFQTQPRLVIQTLTPSVPGARLWLPQDPQDQGWREGETHWGRRRCRVPLFLSFTLQLSSHRAGVRQAPHPPLCPKSL